MAHLPAQRVQVGARRLQHGLDVDPVRLGLEAVRLDPRDEVRRRDECGDVAAIAKGVRERQHRLDVAARSVWSEKDSHLCILSRK